MRRYVPTGRVQSPSVEASPNSRPSSGVHCSIGRRAFDTIVSRDDWTDGGAEEGEPAGGGEAICRLTTELDMLGIARRLRSLTKPVWSIIDVE